jgi:hypothetical protein
MIRRLDATMRNPTLQACLGWASSIVIPAEAGIQSAVAHRVATLDPAFAEMTKQGAGRGLGRYAKGPRLLAGLFVFLS